MPNKRFIFIDRMADTLIGLVIKPENYFQLWSTCKLRTVRLCAHCDNLLKIGDVVWRPLANQNNRGDRLCNQCAAELEKLEKQKWRNQTK